MHPQIAHERLSELGLFDELLAETRYVGEVGLDGAAPYRANWPEQLKVFDHILNSCAQVGGRVLSIHSRSAATAVMDRLEALPGAGTFVLHWFSGSRRELSRAIALGCWFSVGPAMLGNERGRGLAALMPRDRILTESDGPFAKIGNRAAMPWDAELAEQELAQIWRFDKNQTISVLNENLRRLVSSSIPRP